MSGKKENERLPFDTLENHQQNVYKWEEVEQKPFFSVDFHKEGFIPALQLFYEQSRNNKGVCRAVEIDQNGKTKPLTYATACHAPIPNVKNSFLDVFLYRGQIMHMDKRYLENTEFSTEELLKYHKEFVDTLLSFSEDNPWAAAVTQLVVLRDKETEMPEAIFLPSVVNHPARELVSNLFITLRQTTERSYAYLPNYAKHRKEGYSKRASMIKAAETTRLVGHMPWIYQSLVCPKQFFVRPTYWKDNIFPKLNNYCNKACWGCSSVVCKCDLNNAIEKEKVKVKVK